ncbi:agmatine deiminase family protein [Streptomyces alboniger]|uniref:Agmatine deiminase family protein n=2 Tax=Streptomyces alboniger TaxID=132473 RepID=A0A5J6HHP1_STRAD|nr:agmatine deiminase family protein [Streptomyces alboniger]
MTSSRASSGASSTATGTAAASGSAGSGSGLPGRRALGAGALAALGTVALSACGGGPDGRGPAPDRTGPAAAEPGGDRRMPDEAAPHELTYMSWPSRRVWKSYAHAVREDIARIARTIAEFEPVTLLADERDAKAARRACGSGVEILPVPVDDLWMRDTGPSFVLGPDGVAGVDLNFNGWGGKQEHARDSEVARRILSGLRVPRVRAPIVGEGGAIEVDGAGTLLATESSLVNDNRNPGKSRDDIERALKPLFGVTQVLWVDGVRGEDITDYHIDSLARFAEPGVVVMSTPAPTAPDDVWTKVYRQAREALSEAKDARGGSLDLVSLPEPTHIGRRGPDFLASYVNYYVANDAVIMPRFGDRKADSGAASIVRELYPGREVTQLPVNALGEGGGGIHCATQQLPKAP